MKGDKGTKHGLIDFTELDANLEVLVLSIGDFFSKKNNNTATRHTEMQQEKPRIKKKLNVELIKQMILETKQIQEKAKQKQHTDQSQTSAKENKK